MSLAARFKRSWHHLRNPAPVPRYGPPEEQKAEITEAIRKQRFRGDLAGRLEYQDRNG